MSTISEKSELDLDHLRRWLGSTEESRYLITDTLASHYRATLDPWLWSESQEVGPLGIHWCTTLPYADMDNLGPDGHPEHGEFLPPVPLVSRMWAGGEVNFLGPIGVGEMLERNSVIEGVEHKSGRTGELVFVSVKHEFKSGGRPVLSEIQNIVYRDQSPPSRTAKAEGDVSDKGDFQLVPNPVLLFRYSAITFNSHRIHYDQPYATGVEGYPDLVVHGPMQATLLVNLVARIAGGMPSHFKYRGLAPAYCGEPLVFNHEGTAKEGSVWCETADGVKTMQGTYAT